MPRNSERLTRFWVYALAFAIVVGASIALTRPDPVARLAREFSIDEIGYINDRGSVPPLAPVDGARQFSRWQTDLRTRLADVFHVHEINPATVQMSVARSESLRGGLVRETLTFTSFDGTNIPAVLHRPRESTVLPSILLIPGHTKPEESGLAQLVYDDDSYQHAAATALARAGFVTLTFELRGFGLLGAPLNTDHRLVAYNALLEGSFYKRLVLADAQYALAALRAFDFVDPVRTGVAGASLGGELAVTLGALTDDVQAVYFSAFGGSVGPYRYARGDRGAQPHYCHIIPGLKPLMQREDIVLLLAPRPTLAVRGSEDRPLTAAFRTRVATAWSSAGAPDAIEFALVPDRGHEFFVAEAVEFFTRALAATDQR